MNQQAMKLETSQANNVPLRQFSLYRPPYEELYTFWWKCMQITLHDKGTQTISIGEKICSMNDEQTQQTNDSTNESKSSENDQLKQLMAMVNYYNSVGRESRNKSTKTFRGASALAPGFSASMLPTLPETSSASVGAGRGGSSGGGNNNIMEVTTPVMEQRPVFSPSSSATSTAAAPASTSILTSTSNFQITSSASPSLNASVKVEPLLNFGGLHNSSHSSLLPQSLSTSPSTLNSASSPPSLLNTASPSGGLSLNNMSVGGASSPVPSLIKASPSISLLGNPLLISTPSLTSSTTSTSPQEMVLSPATLGTAVLSPSSCGTNQEEKRNNNFSASKIFGGEGSINSPLSASLSAAALLSQPLFSQAMSHLTNSMTSSQNVMASSAHNVTCSQNTVTSSQVISSTADSPTLSNSSPGKHGITSSLNGSPINQDTDKGSPSSLSSPNEGRLSFSDNSDQLSDLIHIKQLTDVLGRKAVLDSLSPSISGATDLSQYLGSTISMAQAASLLGQLPTSTSNRNSLLGSLCSMPLYNMDHELKSDGFSTLDSEVELERSRHYQAAEQDTSNITLPEGFESEDHLTWSEVESFVNEFKTKRVKLGYTQAHVGAALALVHGPEFSQTTISRFEGLQLSFPNHKKIIPILRRWLESVENPTKRRHSSPNGLHGNNQNINSKRRKRTTISSNSKEILEQYYQTNPLPSTEEIGNLSNNLALDKRVIRIWFQNRRAIGKRLSKLIVTMGGGATRNHSNQSSPLATMQQSQHGLF